MDVICYHIVKTGIVYGTLCIQLQIWLPAIIPKSSESQNYYNSNFCSVHISFDRCQKLLAILCVLTFTYFAFGLCLLLHEKLRAVTQLFPSTHILNSMVCCGESLPSAQYGGMGGLLKEHVAGDIWGKGHVAETAVPPPLGRMRHPCSNRNQVVPYSTYCELSDTQLSLSGTWALSPR